MKQDEPRPKPSRHRRLWRCWIVGTFCLSAMWIAGRAFGDGCWLTWLFFCIPSPVVLCVLLITGLHSLWRRHRRLGIALGMLAIAPACFVGAVENRWTSAAVPSAGWASLRLVHWNVFRGHLGWEGAARALTSRNANIYVISEFPKDVDIGDAAARAPCAPCPTDLSTPTTRPEAAGHTPGPFRVRCWPSTSA